MRKNLGLFRISEQPERAPRGFPAEYIQTYQNIIKLYGD